MYIYIYALLCRYVSVTWTMGGKAQDYQTHFFLSKLFLLSRWNPSGQCVKAYIGKIKIWMPTCEDIHRQAKGEHLNEIDHVLEAKPLQRLTAFTQWQVTMYSMIAAEKKLGLEESSFLLCSIPNWVILAKKKISDLKLKETDQEGKALSPEREGLAAQVNLQKCNEVHHNGMPADCQHNSVEYGLPHYGAKYPCMRCVNATLKQKHGMIFHQRQNGEASSTHPRSWQRINSVYKPWV